MKTTICCLLLLTTGFAFGQTKKPVKKLAHTCVAGPDEQCPSDLQIREWNEIKALEAKYAPPVPTDEDRIRYQGLTSDWNTNIPKGYTWSKEKLRWIKTPEPPKPVVAPEPPKPTTEKK